MQNDTTPIMTDVYSIVTNKIIELLEAGTIPWRRPWTDAGLPMNLITKRHYRGINIHLLNSLGYEQNLFLTWKQLKTIGGSVRKGETGIIVVFNKIIEQQIEAEGETKLQKKSLLRYYKVFNISQCTDIPSAFIPQEGPRVIEPIVACEMILENMVDCPPIRYEAHEAYYVPSLDYINMPKMDSFISSLEFYTTLFHEVIHATGHQKRVGRKEVYQNPKFGTEMYSMEELVAEMGSCYLKSHVGIPIEELDNSAAYVANWLQVLKGDKRFIVIASSKAQRAVEYVLHAPVQQDNNSTTLSNTVNQE